jgi:hypothetical protein
MPSGPRRSGKGAIPDISGWATEQARLLSEADLDQTARQTAAVSVVYHGGDPTPLVAVIVNGEWLPLALVVSNFLARGIEIILIKQNSYKEKSTDYLNSDFKPWFFGYNKKRVEVNQVKFIEGVAWLPSLGSITGAFYLERIYY